MKTYLNYIITEFNEETNTITVDFPDDKQWAQVRLVNEHGTIPNNKEELDALISKYATPLDVIENTNIKTNFSFINNMVNKKIKTDRYSARLEREKYEAELRMQLDQEQTPSDEINTLDVDAADNIQIAEKAYIKLIVEEILKEYNLI